MTYTMKAMKPKKFLAEFCGEELRDQVVTMLTAKSTIKFTPEQLVDLKEKSRPESYLLAAFVVDWYQVRAARPSYYFRSGRWFVYPERRLLLPAEALPGLLFTTRQNTGLDFDYVHSDWNDIERTENVGDLTPAPETMSRLRGQMKSLFEAGVDFDTGIWRLAKAQYPLHVFNTAKEDMWCVDLNFSGNVFRELSSESRSLDGKI